MLEAHITYLDDNTARGVLFKAGIVIGFITGIKSPRFTFNPFKLKSYRGRAEDSIVTIDTGETFEVNTQNVKLLNSNKWGE